MPILIVDDDRDTREALSEYLGMHGFRCLSAANGVEAVQIARERHPQAIILDLVMPGPLNGMDVLMALKGAAATSAIPILALTGLTGVRDEVKALGCDDYMLKPIDPRELVHKLRRLRAFTPPPV